MIYLVNFPQIITKYYMILVVVQLMFTENVWTRLHNECAIPTVAEHIDFQRPYVFPDHGTVAVSNW